MNKLYKPPPTTEEFECQKPINVLCESPLNIQTSSKKKQKYSGLEKLSSPNWIQTETVMIRHDRYWPDTDFNQWIVYQPQHNL